MFFRQRFFRKLVCFVWVMIFSAAAPAIGAIPHLIHYQGRLNDSNGNPLQGSYNITFRIYTQSSGGTTAWNETQNNVTTDTNGIFEVLLGSSTALDLAFDTSYWLGVEIDNDGEMTPRERIATSAYAYRAEIADSIADGVVDDDWTVSGSSLYRVSGNVGIGTANPNAFLHISPTSAQASENLLAAVSPIAPGGEVLIASAAGNVGIGEATPDAVLEVSGNSGDTDLLMISSSDNADGDRFLVTSAGNVGIGTATPNSLLHINGADPEVRVQDSSANGNGALSIAGFYQNNDTRTGYVGDGSYDNEDMYVWAEKGNLRLGTALSGNIIMAQNGEFVGIGTDTPQVNLHIKGNPSQPSGLLWLEAEQASGNRDPSIRFNDGDGSILSEIGSHFLGSGVPVNFRVLNYRSGQMIFATNAVTNDTGDLVIDSSGNVGIGNNDPATKLEVSGTVTATAFVGDGSQLTGVSASSSDSDWDVPTASTVSTTKNVGIGTANPNSLLHINGADPEVRVQDSSANGNGALSIAGFYQNNDTRTGYVGDGSYDNEDMYVWAEKGNLRLGTALSGNIIMAQNGENVGIGKTDPTNKLEVIQSASSGDGGVFKIDNASNNQDAVKGWIANGQGNAVIGMTYSNTSTSDGVEGRAYGTAGHAGRFEIDNASNSKPSVYSLVVNGSGPLYGGNHTGASGNLIDLQSSGVSKFSVTKSGTVTAAGFVGDGSQLTGISGSGAWTASGNTSYKTTGNVGIGTATPSVSLHIQEDSTGIAPYAGTTIYTEKNGQNVIQIVSGNGNDGMLMFGDVDSNLRGNIHYNHATDMMSLYTAGNPQVRIDSGGYVGIGTSTPVRQLNVKGTGDYTARFENTSSTDNIIEFNDSDGDRWMINARGGSNDDFFINNSTRGGEDITIEKATGYVGVSDSAPNTTLDVQGTIRVAGNQVDPTSGAGVEIRYFHPDQDPNNPFGEILAYDRDSVQYKDLGLNAANLRFYIDGLLKAKIDNAGNMGIGIDTPATKLDVSGTVTATAFVGDGSQLTGVLKDNAEDTIAADLNVTGTVSATSFSGDGSALSGIGSWVKIKTLNPTGSDAEFTDSDITSDYDYYFILINAAGNGGSLICQVAMGDNSYENTKYDYVYIASSDFSFNKVQNDSSWTMNNNFQSSIPFLAKVFIGRKNIEGYGIGGTCEGLGIEVGSANIPVRLSNDNAGDLMRIKFSTSSSFRSGSKFTLYGIRD